MAHLSDPDSGCLPVADERFSHSFPYALKCQRKCPSGSNYRCSLGGTAALLSNTWNWQQAGKRRHQTLLGAPSHLPEQLIVFLGSLRLEQSRGVQMFPGMNPIPLPPTALLLSLKSSRSLLKQKRIQFQPQSFLPMKWSHGWIWIGFFADVAGRSPEDKAYLHPTERDSQGCSAVLLLFILFI